MSANCHPERPRHARGLCRACYGRLWWRQIVPKSEKRRAQCHPERSERARGLCCPCYMRFSRRGSPELEVIVARHDEKRPARRVIPMTSDWPSVAKKLKHARKVRGISRRALADHICVNLHTLYRWENDLASPSFGMFLRWCERLNYKMDLRRAA